jgi:hypothetical protein
MFLVLPILSSEFHAFARDGPNGQDLLAMIEPRPEAGANHRSVAKEGLSHNALKRNKIDDFLAAEKLEIGEKVPGLGSPSCYRRTPTKTLVSHAPAVKLSRRSVTRRWRHCRATF